MPFFIDPISISLMNAASAPAIAVLVIGLPRTFSANPVASNVKTFFSSKFSRLFTNAIPVLGDS